MAKREGSADSFDVIHAHLLDGFAATVTELGGDPADVLRAAALAPEPFLSGHVPVTYRQTVILLETAAARLACPDFGMRLARLNGGIAVFGPLGVAMRNCRSFGEALAYVHNHNYAHSLAAQVSVRPTPDKGGAFVGHDILLEGVPHRAQALERILLAGHLGALELTGGHARARAVHFRHQPVSAPRIYRDYFGCSVRFGQPEDGVFYSAADLACPIAAPDPGELAAITDFIDRTFTRHRPPLHAEVRGIVMRLLGHAVCTNTEIADRIGLHPRTLHRRLRTEGTSFQRIKDEIRRDILLYYLARTDIDFTRISEKLGFAEQSVMTRSCQRWFGTSPTGLRAQERSIA
ncbi:MAG: AraC family transcriptional regulator [Novosphingobium sp.]